ncbi:MAG: hypothetical protein ACI89D_001263 [Bermanella sp.]|jgi:hypothetical protein
MDIPLKTYRLHFEALTHCLLEHQALWRCQPFVQIPDWVSKNPSLTASVAQLDTETVRAAQSSDALLLDCLAPILPEQCKEIKSLCELPQFPAPSAEANPISHIPGRKWQQITHFTAAIQHCENTLLEWCAGKAHLGRWLSQHYGCTVIALECDNALIESAASLSPPVQFEQCDVLGLRTLSFLKASQHALALHACGGLHRKLLNDASACGLERITWSPCCYHKYLDSEYQPLSSAGAAAELELRTAELRTAVRQNTTAGRAERLRHEKLQAWRLGFNRLIQDTSGDTDYLAITAIPADIIRGDFPNFCAYVAELKNITLPKNITSSKYEKLGVERYSEVSRQELVRELFRRPLELWIVLDEMLFLEERGYRCELGIFCDAQITPRNLLIDAKRTGFPEQ